WVCVPIFALARFDLILPLRILILVMSAFSLGTSILFYRLLGKIFTPAIGAIAATYWAFNTDILNRVYQQGLETGMAAFFVLFFVYKLYKFETSQKDQTTRQLSTLGILGIFVILSRLDLIFFVIMAGIWVVFRRHPLRYFLPFDIVAIVISVLLGFIFRLSFNEFPRYSDVAITMIIISLVVKVIGAFLFDLYKSPNEIDREKMAKSLILFGASTAAFVGAVMLIILPFTNFEGFPRTIIVYDFVLTVIFFGATRYAALGLSSSASKPNYGQSPIEQWKANWKIWLTNGFVYFGIVGSAMALYMLWNKITFGTPSPVSGQIKRWWGSLSGNVYGGSAPNVLSFFGIDYLGDANAWHPISSIWGQWAEAINILRIPVTQRYLLIISIAAILFYAVLLLNRQKSRNSIVLLGIIPLFCGAWIQVISYHITGYAAYKEWYWVAQLVTQVFVVALVAGVLYETVRDHPATQKTLWLLATGIFIFMGTVFWTTIKDQMQYDRWQAADPNNDLAEFLEEHTEPGSVIGMTGGGNAGYFINDRTVINMDGLINSYDYFNFLKSKTAGNYLGEIGMDYVLANPAILAQLPYRNQFEPYIEGTGFQYGGKDLMRYQTPSP
ncbi:MAG TPA: hypothetical protein VK851_09665, partial [Anaerolineales bacterium]|nr:hypothetical protein [Anaerolineales bacterium]